MSLKYNSHFSGNFCLDPEKVDTSKFYCFTFNPQIQPLDINGSKAVNNSLWQFEPADNLSFNLKPWFDACHVLFDNFRGAEVKDMVVEISKKGRYHWHGRLRITDIVSFFSFDIPILEAKSHYFICEELGDAPSDKKTEYKTWDEYLQKQQKFMKKYLEDNGCVKVEDHIQPGEILKLRTKFRVSRGGDLRERVKEVLFKKCRVCKKDFQTTLKKVVCCEKCKDINYMP